MRVDKVDAEGSALALTWDTTACDARGHHLLFGGSAEIPSTAGGDFDIAGAVCDIGATSPFVWRNVPDPVADPRGLLWWIVVAHDGAGTEGSWGRDGAGTERVGPGPGGASLVCGIALKSIASACGQ